MNPGRWIRRRFGSLVDWTAAMFGVQPLVMRDPERNESWAALDALAGKSFLRLVERRGGPRNEAMRAYCTAVEAKLFEHGISKPFDVWTEMEIVLGRAMKGQDHIDFQIERLALGRRLEMERRFPWLRRAAAAE